uniref:NADH dehydrogenase subunit 6 n=1 Tax=Cornu aspersum TaxID=6535 RepID=S4SA84_CORAP|nr:NADH dehydrogenase subunit 6 [Cornu aspersum]
MYLFSCSLFLFLTIFIFLLATMLTSSLMLIVTFFVFTGCTSIGSYLMFNDFLPYMLYLVYVGGLLVLLIYMMIISTNTHFHSTPYLWIVFLSFISMLMTVFLLTNFEYQPTLVQDSGFVSTSMWYFHFSALVVLVALLLYVFMFICESLRLGGRSLNVGNRK